ncbi:MAG TPA: FecR family protein [Chitinophaga sp.]|uniref:FecR family protein n=1 Tax=Chitinophaga sp. TaxID=1869181 RepID=UPI002B5AC09E|nr:FecR family protein [Chitinophaga sp.]HVI43424.1 FecR family protein [Chitinophaga sp.]
MAINDVLRALRLAKDLVYFLVVDQNLDRLPELKQWYQRNNNNQVLTTRLSDPTRWSRIRSACKNYDPEAPLQRALARIAAEQQRKRTRMIVMLRAAAVVLPLIGVIAYCLSLPVSKHTPVVSEHNSNRSLMLAPVNTRTHHIFMPVGDSVFSIAEVPVVVQKDTMSVGTIAKGGSERVILEIPSGRNCWLKLPDGSRARIRAGSSLAFDIATFARTLEMEGEAFFEVQASERRPFIIHGAAARITVLGTRFNLKADSTSMEVTLISGKLQLSTADTILAVLPGTKTVLHNKLLNVSIVDTTAEPAWIR